jgi:photosystem II stability/assembly factor-like uncharacterized protein
MPFGPLFRASLAGLPLALVLVLLPLPGAGLARAAVDPALLAGLAARSIGPAGMSGRIAAVEGVVGNRNILYAGAATGGVWKTEDGGLTWRPIFDDQPVHSIGALAVHPKYPDVVWVGTGEGNIRNSVSYGNGVYRSLDAGRTWRHLGLPESERIHRILLHPEDPEVAYVAVMGKLWGDSMVRGVYKTIDGGATWTQVLAGNARTGCGDLAMDPDNPNKLFAAMYEFRRQPWFFESGGKGSGLFVTHDGGTSWTRLEPEDGLPKGPLGRIGVAVAPSDAKRVYAFIEDSGKNGIYRSLDGGVTWQNTGATSGFGNRPFYYADLRVDPDYPDRVYSLFTQVAVSDDGGTSWKTLIPTSGLHPDHHAMWIDPADGAFIVEGNDGGVGISTDRGATWRFVRTLPLGQFYHVAVDMDLPYNVYGGMQDNGSWRGPSSVWVSGGIQNHHWQEVGFGDGFDVRPHPNDSRRGYSMYQAGNLMRWNLDTGEIRLIRPAPEAGDTLRFNWNAAIAQDPFDAETIYYGSQYVHRSPDGGLTWTRISPDLTSDDPTKQRQVESGGLTPDITGAENFTTIVAIEPNPLARGVLWVGTDDGRVHVTRDGGANWTRVDTRAPGVPPGTWVPHIGASPHDAGTAFVVFDNHRRSDVAPYVYRVTDYGARWTSLVTPDIEGYALVIEQDPVNPELLFLGTELGLCVSQNGGRDWFRWTHGLPTSSVMDLTIHPREHDLVLGTHGRSAYIVDDMTPLRTLDDAIVARPLHLFPPPPARQYTTMQPSGERFPGSGVFRGPSRPYGALLTFWADGDSLPHPDADVERERKRARREAESPVVRPTPAGASAATPGSGRRGGGRGGDAEGPRVSITVRDSTGATVRTFDRPAHRGVNRIAWDLTSDPFEGPPRRDGESGGGGGGAGSGPEVPPGTYEVTLKLLGQEVRDRVVVLSDPRAPLSAADRLAGWQAQRRAGRLLESLGDAVRRIDAARKDLEFVRGRLRATKEEMKKANGAAPDSAARAAASDTLDALLRDAGRLDNRLVELDGELRRPADAKGSGGPPNLQGELRRIQGFLGSTKDRPSATVLEYFARFEELYGTFLPRFNRVFDEELPPFRRRLEAHGLFFLEEKPPLALPEPR